MDFDNLDLLFSDMYSTVDTEVTPKLAEEIETVVQEESEHIYDEFTPTQYVRTYDFADRDNIQSNITKVGNETIITTMNNSLAKGDEEGEFLDDIIENGERYGWSHKPPKRPVFERSIERIQGEQLVENIVKSTLGRKYDVE